MFKTVLSNVHDGNANHDLEFNFLRGIALPSATEDTKALFARSDGIVLAPTWKLCRPYTINTLVQNVALQLLLAQAHHADIWCRVVWCEYNFVVYLCVPSFN